MIATCKNCGYCGVANSHTLTDGSRWSACRKCGSENIVESKVCETNDAVSNETAECEMQIVGDGYDELRHVLNEAVQQAASGKGKERHASDGEPYEDQAICEITRRVGHGYPRGQAVKKIFEAERLPKDRAIAELLGAINYIAASIIVMRDK